MSLKPIHCRLPVVILGLLLCVPARADRFDDDGSRRHDHEHAHRALARGEVRPLAEILARVAAEVPGEVVDVEFERKNWQGTRVWIYELKIIAADGRLLEVLVNAATGQILEVEQD
ncbi:PepSY domain-containing protein [uncultured Thiocystis sp.]|uniref:PepSY domain-containing protein n=1 Tax=uncultured Thiocystis sp. TaxID=1202134 RepID=UPI0025F5208E|nr:PepSY domain-containing protein [uncultured Thiocystis sp.]